jgi:DNA helicase II / ATP-dependent DNA helicase PcrA
VLAAQNAADFDDLLIKTALLLGDHPDIRERLEDQYRYVLVDEYQDTNHAQYLIARGLCLVSENLCVTGDPDQSIYGWRGANIHNILQFEEDFPDAKVVHLEQNYRSTPQILAAADAVIARNRKRKKKKLWTGNIDGEQVRVAECEHAQAEATFIAAEIGRHVEAGGRLNDVAIFYRVNALSRNLEAALRSAQIAYQVARGVAFFQRREIKDTLAYLRLLANPQDQVALLRIINMPARGIGDVTVQRVLQHAAATDRTALDVLQAPRRSPELAARPRRSRSSPS